MDLIETGNTSAQQRVAALRKLPLFSGLSPFDLMQLQALFHDVVYPKNQIIVKHNEVVDSVYVILEGDAEVTRDEMTPEGIQKQVLAVLHAGETIGLSDTGFFSPGGLRAATVTAITPAFLIRISLVEFRDFITATPAITADIQKTAGDLQKLNFIKQIEPFATIEHSLLLNVLEHIEEHDVPVGTVFFKQGDQADCCYLLGSGKVEITVTKQGDTEPTVVAELKDGALFGELALLTEGLRNASAVAVTPCKVLVLKQTEFKQLIQQSPKAFDVLTGLMLDRNRPQQCEGITIHTRTDKEGKVITILKNEKEGKYFQISEKGLFVWNYCDGEHTIQDISVAYYFQFHELATEDIGNLVVSLMNAGFIKVPALVSYVDKPTMPLRWRLLAGLTRIMEYEYAFKNVDDWVTYYYNKVGYLFYTFAGKVAMALLAICGFIAFVNFTPFVGPFLKNTPNVWILLFLVGPANIITVPFHELAHAFTTKAYGRRVHRFGVGWYWMGPMAFADTSDMWLSTRGPRMAVNLAGVYVNVVISGIAALVGYLLPDQTMAVFLWLVALSGYMIVFYNLDPSFELDGYYVLMDALDTPNLRFSAIQWLLMDSKSEALSRKYIPEMTYWVACIAFIGLAAYLGYFIQVHLINNLLPPQLGNFHPSHYRWLFVVIVLVISFASLYAKVKQQATLYRR